MSQRQRFALAGRLLALLLLVLSGVGAEAAASDTIRVELQGNKALVRYQVKPGETVYTLATAFQCTPTDIQRLNQGVNPDELEAGQSLLIPYRAVNRNAAATAPVLYVVKPGDTFYSLAVAFRTSVTDLERWNGPKLTAGKQIIVGYGFAEGNRLVTEQPNVAAAHEELEHPKAPKKEEPRILVIPFDPHLYFSDADEEISRQSKIPRQQVRYIFRDRLNAFLERKGYESIRLTGGIYRDTVEELNRLYRSVKFDYQDVLYSKHNPERQAREQQPEGGASAWLKSQKEKLNKSSASTTTKGASQTQPTRYFGVQVRDPNFFPYFNDRYDIDYYIFINQFEVKTLYTHCLDRSSGNYQRDFLIHYSIFNKKGEQIAGNKARVFYNSNSNDVQKIVGENMQKIADIVLADLPSAPL